MFLDVEHNVQIPRGTSVWSGLTLTRHAEACSRVNTRRNTQLDRSFALDASLSAAFHTALAHDLPRSLACGTSPRNREKTLLVRQLTSPVARLTSNDAGSLFRAGAIARFAILLARQLYLGSNPRRSLFERQGHVIAKISATLRASASTTATPTRKHILETEEVPE